MQVARSAWELLLVWSWKYEFGGDTTGILILPVLYDVMQILFVLVDLANKEVASPVVDFFMLRADKTSVIFLKIMSHLSIIVESWEYS
jgi:hypothetical protein